MTCKNCRVPRPCQDSKQNVVQNVLPQLAWKSQISTGLTLGLQASLWTRYK
uniref:Uncharacterized protein n=1 Tax=Arundo donax TaxID=35708 RepID=A0A0A8XUA8_ARUDO